MNRKRHRQHLLLGLALVATLAAAYMAPDPEADGGVLLADRSARTAGTSAAPPSRAPGKGAVAADVLEIRARDAEADDRAEALFAAGAWQVDAPVTKTEPVVPVVQGPAVPHAPPLPFRTIGRYEEDGVTVFFLQHNERGIVARVGDTVAEHYKVESVQGNLLTLTHLPTNQTQTLDVGGTS
ncbi:hypothetical protein [Rhizobacter sp. LjRoot28]|uniref:hypothetical protein n=1 Tax=Rhizobacter sp. LjRoot28 TaxID=3342309 RepID=UPI003ED0A24C